MNEEDKKKLQEYINSLNIKHPETPQLKQGLPRDVQEVINSSVKEKQLGENLKSASFLLKDIASAGLSALWPVGGVILGLGDAAVSTLQGDPVTGTIQAGAEALPYGLGKAVKPIMKMTDKATKIAEPMQNKFNLLFGYKELPEGYAYRRTLPQEYDDIIESGMFRSIPDGKELQGISIQLPNGKTVTLRKAKGNSHGGKAFSYNREWKGTDASGSKNKESIIIGVPIKNANWKTGYHGSYSDVTDLSKLNSGDPLFVPFDENGIANINTNNLVLYKKINNRYKKL